MTKKDIVSIIILLVLAGFGVLNALVFNHRFAGGIITGSCGLMALLVLIGKRQASRAAAKIDKKIMDHYTDTFK